MYNAVVSIVAKVSARIKMLRCVRHFYHKSELIALYKSHVLTFLESCIPAYYHVHPSILKLLDEVQNDFLESILIPTRDALLKFNLGPLCLRRDILMLGVLHKVVVGSLQFYCIIYLNEVGPTYGTSGLRMPPTSIVNNCSTLLEQSVQFS